MSGRGRILLENFILSQTYAYVYLKSVSINNFSRHLRLDGTV